MKYYTVGKDEHTEDVNGQWCKREDYKKENGELVYSMLDLTGLVAHQKTLADEQDKLIELQRSHTAALHDDLETCNICIVAAYSIIKEFSPENLSKLESTIEKEGFQSWFTRVIKSLSDNAPTVEKNT